MRFAFLLLPAFVLAQSKDEEIGRQLFNDPRLSANGKVSCATCHKEDKGFTAGGLPLALGGGSLSLKAPSLWNVASQKSLFWDGRAATLEEQIVGPLTNQREMGNKTVKEAAKRVDLSEAALIRYITTYERSLVSAPSRLDEYLGGRSDGILNESEVRGWNLFRGQARCYLCHVLGNGFKDDKFHNTGLANEGGKAGGLFKTPSLKKTKFAGPYMHDCSLKTLEDVVKFYNEGGRKNPNLDKDIKPLKLNRREIDDLVAILKAI